MENSILFMILFQLFLIALNAVFACAEIAVISMNDTKLAKMAENGDKRAIRLARLTSQPARFLATIQVAITLSGFLGSAFAAENFSDVLVNWITGLGINIPVKTLDTIAVVFITIILSYFTLVFGELVPKQIAMRKAEPLALAMSSLISTISRIFAPLVSFLTFSTNSILRLIGMDPDSTDDTVSEEEIRMMVDVGSEKGTIDHHEKEFIQNVFEFDDLTAGDIVTHRTDIIMLNTEDSDEIWKETIFSSRYTLYPVCNESIDKIAGILSAKKYFRLENKHRDNVMKNAITSAYFVPESIPADVLFRNMKRDRVKMAVVLDEYGGTSGIVTINDLVELLVGEILDSDHGDIPAIRQIKPDVWMVSGSAYLEDISKETGVNLDSRDYDTFNGYIFQQLSAVPTDDSTMEFDTDKLHIKITGIKNHQIETAFIRLNNSDNT